MFSNKKVSFKIRRFILIYAYVLGKSENPVEISVSKLVDNQQKKEIFASDLKSFQS